MPLKKSGELRVRIDPKPLNSALKRESYQKPVIDDMLAKLHQPYGRYRWLRQPFGLNVSSEIFQKRVHQGLQGLPGVKCIAGDVLLNGKNDKDQDSNLAKFMRGCQKIGIKLNREKLELKCKQVAIHVISNC